MFKSKNKRSLQRPSWAPSIHITTSLKAWAAGPVRGRDEEEAASWSVGVSGGRVCCWLLNSSILSHVAGSNQWPRLGPNSELSVCFGCTSLLLQPPPPPPARAHLLILPLHPPPHLPPSSAPNPSIHTSPLQMISALLPNQSATDPHVSILPAGEDGRAGRTKGGERSERGERGCGCSLCDGGGGGGGFVRQFVFSRTTASTFF